MRFRTFWTIMTFGAIASVALGTIGLGIVATELRAAATKSARTTSGMQLAQAFQVDLYAFHRLGNLYLVSGDQDYAVAMREKRRELQSEANRTLNALLPGEGREEFRDVVASFQTYLTEADTLGEDSSFEQEFRSGNLALETVLAALKNFDEALGERSREAYGESEAWEFIGYALAGLLLLIAFVGLTAVYFLMRQGVYYPLLSLRAGIHKLRPGEDAGKIPVSGFREVKEVAESVNLLADELHEQRGRQLEFLSAVAHDLRTPLTSIKGFTQLLARSRPLPPEEKLYDTFGLLERQSNRIHRMVNDLLEATRVEGGRFNLEPKLCNIVDSVREVAEMMGTGENRVIHVSVPQGPIELCCDPSRMEQVVTNLVSNALKYSPPDQDIDIEIHRENNTAVISVTDRGIGVAEEDKRTIFQPFRRTELTKTEYPGVGLGLSVSRRIVEAHGGTIELDSELGEGSTFRVRLPVRTDCEPE